MKVVPITGSVHMTNNPHSGRVPAIRVEGVQDAEDRALRQEAETRVLLARLANLLNGTNNYGKIDNNGNGNNQIIRWWAALAATILVGTIGFLFLENKQAAEARAEMRERLAIVESQLRSCVQR